MKTKFIITCLIAAMLIGCSDTKPSDTDNKHQSSVAPLASSKADNATQEIKSESPISTNESPAQDTPQLTKDTLEQNLLNQMSKLYEQKCSSCHGSYAEKAALGKSKIIVDLSEEQIKEALHGYKNGTFGGSYKANMIAVLKTLNEEQMDNLAAYIASLK